LLVDWYNCVIAWLADVASHPSLQQLSWPPAEFSGTRPILHLLCAIAALLKHFLHWKFVTQTDFFSLFLF